LLEALAHGLPVVMFDLDIPITENNKNIIKIPQNDIDSAADTICNLLDKKRIAEQVIDLKDHDFNGFKLAIDKLLSTYDRFSIYRNYLLNDYKKAIKYMTFYAGKTWPFYSFLH
ncbi:MAG: hypothetical protein HDQ88_05105, partial [Clostridia bacterium]|nr:hypothetical protein [Clostridia bacterium]